MLADFVDGADSRMIERRCGPRFTAEALQSDRILGNVERQKLERHVPAQGGVLGLVHHPHAAPAQLLQNAVMRDGDADSLSLLLIGAPPRGVSKRQHLGRYFHGR